jgi:broad specificity phosphatase PhoE
MTDIWLVRHAATSWTGTRWSGRSDPPLTPSGEADAASLAALLAPILAPRTVILSSPARRALATARAIADAFEIPENPGVIADADLQEVDFGRVDGLTFDEVEARYPRLARRLAGGETDIDWPGGETSVDVRARTQRAWATLAAAAERSTVVAVTHGGLISRVLRDLLGSSGAPAPHLAPASAIRVQLDISGRVGNELVLNDPTIAASHV